MGFLCDFFVVMVPIIQDEIQYFVMLTQMGFPNLILGEIHWKNVLLCLQVDVYVF